MMNDPMLLLAFALIYIATGIGLLALAGGFAKPRLQAQPIRIDSRRGQPRRN